MPRSLFCSFFKLLRLILVATAVCTLAPASFAQVATGTPPFGSFAGGPDVVNLANLNDHLAIPVLHKAGRGTDFGYDLSYDSSVWYPVGVSPNQLWQPVSNWGWASQTQGPNGYIAYNTTQIKITCTTGNNIIYKTYYLNQYTYTTYYDQFGAAHTVNATVSQQLIPGFTGCSPNPAYPYSATVNAYDGSGLTFSLSAQPSAAVITAGGTTIYPPYNQSSGSGSYTDRNGNIISTSGGVFTDTLGTTALTVTGGGTASSPMVFTYTPPNTSSSRCVSTNTTGVACYTMNYTNFTVATNFGVSGIGEYKSSAAVPLVSSIVLPDGSQYTFQYEATPGSCTPYSGTTCVTGRVTQITLPTGGQISFAYSFTGCTTTISKDGSTACLQRTTPDGTWTYARTLGSGAASATLVTAPKLPYDSASNQTIIQFQGIYETQRDVYKGLAPTYSAPPIAENILTISNLLAETQTCYNTGTTSCTGTTVTLPITQRTVTKQLAGATSWLNALTCQHIEKYSSYGVPIEQDDYDYGVGVVGALLRKTTLTVQPLGNINTFYEQVQVTNGSGATVSNTLYVYDGTSVVATSSTPQHTTVSGSRGNLTSVNSYYSSSGYVQAKATYFDTGNIQTATDVNGAQTTFTYGACGNSFPTSVSEPLSMTRSLAWNCTGGVMTQLTDENGQSTGLSTTLTYSDPYFWRPASESFPDGGQISWTYNSQTNLTTTTKMNSSQNIVNTVLLDTLGRTKETQMTSDPEGVDYRDATYDALGRIASVTNPYRSTSDSTYGAIGYTYDALGRTTKVTLQDGSAVTTLYTNNTITATDPAGIMRQSMLDSLGRITQVIEDPGSSPHLNYLTSYILDPLGNILNVTQNGGRARTFVYDELSRLTSETNPETGTIAYNYNSSGDLSSRVSPAQNQTGSATVAVSYCYDQLHRITAKAYTYSPANPPTCSGTPPTFPSPAATYLYDASSVDSDPNPFKNPIGRLVKTQQFGLGTYANTYFDYDPVGRIQHVAHCAPAITQNCLYTSTPSWWIVSNTYDLAGNLTSYTDGFGHTLTQSFDSAGRPSQLTSSWVDSTHPATLATVDSSVGYYPPGALRKMNLANGLTQTGALNNALQPCRINWNSTATALGTCSDAIPSGNLQDFNYGFNAGSSDNGNVMNWTATGQQGFTRSFTYDSLNRLHQMTETSGSSEGCKPASSSSSPYNLTWSYDAWGNRNAQTPSSGTCSFSQSANSNNQLGSPYQYDAAGNMTNDGNLNYFYDAENRLVEVYAGQYLGTQPPSCSSATACYLANGLGQRAIKYINPGGKNTYYIHGSDGQMVSYTDTSGNWNLTYLYFGGARLAEYAGTGTYFFHPDHLGSTRLGTDMNHNVTTNPPFGFDFLPFGEQIAGDNSTIIKFTGLERDSETNLDHTDFRQYSSQLGRWMHPDPAGLAAVDPTNPQSWNRYSYVMNSPLNLIDPFGLCGGGPGANGGPCYDGWYIGDDGCAYNVTYSQQQGPDGNTYDIPTVTQGACGFSSSQFPGFPPGTLFPGNPPTLGGGGGGGAPNSNGLTPSQQAVQKCRQEAQAAFDAQPPITPNADNIVVGIVTAIVNVIIKGKDASVGDAAKGFGVGVAVRSGVHAVERGEMYRATLEVCMQELYNQQFPNSYWNPYTFNMGHE